MKHALFLSCAALLLQAPLQNAFAEATPGQPAPAFEEKDANGKSHKLADFKGKWVVLEWYNKDCPFVKKHYGAGNMQALQKEFTGKDVVWLTVNSSAEGKQGYLNPADTLKNAKSAGSNATATLLDTDGSMGKAYGAKTTPHMYVINPQGTLAYAGGIDDNDSADPAVIAKSKNFVRLALADGLAGKPVTVATSRPYGCSVKY